MKLIYIGDHFYSESGSLMSPIYGEDGSRSDWGKVQMALRQGDEVSIRQATQQERDFYEARLSRMKREIEQERSNAPHEGRTAALSPGVPLDAVVGRQNGETE